MNLQVAIALYAGGPGSGCNPEVGKCGRPPGAWQLRKFESKTGLVGRHFRHGTVVAGVYQKLVDAKGGWVNLNQFPKGMEGVATVRKAGKESGKWLVERDGDNFRLVMTEKKNIAEQSVVMDMIPIEKHLLSDKITSSEDLGGGVNETVKVKFANGSYGVWKPAPFYENPPRNNIKGGFATEREAGAWVVAKLAGMKDLGTPAVIRTIDGRKGVLLDWNPGTVAHGVNRNDRYDGNKDLARAAAFDYVIGNEDRHAGNWIVNNGQLKLIDHGISFPDRGEFQGLRNAYLIDEARHRNLEAPKNFASGFIDAKEEIFTGLKNVGLSEEAIDGVRQRIDKLATAKKWGELKYRNLWGN